jgi:hypothetical protein
LIVAVSFNSTSFDKIVIGITKNALRYFLLPIVMCDTAAVISSGWLATTNCDIVVDGTMLGRVGDVGCFPRVLLNFANIPRNFRITDFANEAWRHRPCCAERNNRNFVTRVETRFDRERNLRMPAETSTTNTESTVDLSAENVTSIPFGKFGKLPITFGSSDE